MKNLSRLIIMISVILFFSTCKKDETEVSLNPKKIVLTAEQSQLVDASNEFGFKMLNKVAMDEPDGKNVLISPLSIELALSMALNGAMGATNDAMREAMQFNDMEMNQINVSFKNLMQELLSVDEKVSVDIANSIWYRNTFGVEQKFIDVNKDYYDAQVMALDFDSPTAKNVINKWVADKTRDNIKTIIDAINPDHVMFLINAIYFKGLWATEFNAAHTSSQPFYLNSGAVKKVPTMMQNNTFHYYAGNNFTAAELLYGRGNYSMVIILPNVGTNVEELLSQFSSDKWNEITNKLTPMLLDVQLPKFKFAYEKTLNDMLKAMGMGIAFTEFADLRGINRNGGLFISEVKHKTFVEVNEEGTEASAATSVGVGIVSMPVTINFSVNRPFIFAIREKYSNAILFIGSVNEPLIEN